MRSMSHPRTAPVSPNFPMSPLKIGPLRAIASRTALVRMRSVLEALSFLKLPHMIDASAPMSTRPRSLPRAAFMYGRQFREGFGQFASCLQVTAPWQHEFP